MSKTELKLGDLTIVCGFAPLPQKWFDMQPKLIEATPLLRRGGITPVQGLADPLDDKLVQTDTEELL